jgi:hypothetical protein
MTIKAFLREYRSLQTTMISLKKLASARVLDLIDPHLKKTADELGKLYNEFAEPDPKCPDRKIEVTFWPMELTAGKLRIGQIHRYFDFPDDKRLKSIAKQHEAARISIHNLTHRLSIESDSVINIQPEY